MKESRFIHRRKKQWQDFEKEIDREDSDPTKLSSAYLEVIDDLAYSRTHYPKRFVRSYLNGLAQELGLRVYRSSKGQWKRMKAFWQYELPKSSYQCRRSILFAFLLFLSCMGIGLYSNAVDPAFARQILGNEYIDMTLANIEKGDPMSVYKDGDMGGMFLGITLNNTRIAAGTYALGLLAGIGTLLVLLFNGVMVGVFQGFFIEQGLFVESFLTIWQHGVVEISSIILSGAAGFELSRGLLFPATLSRWDALRASGKRSVRLLMGVIPLLVYSGFIESFFTRFTHLPDVLRLSTILLSMLAVFFYFWWYPRMLYRKSDPFEQPENDIKPIAHQSFQPDAILKMAQLIRHSVAALFNIKWWHLLLSCLPVILIFTLNAWKDALPSQMNLMRYFHHRDSSVSNQTYAILTMAGIGLSSVVLSLRLFTQITSISLHKARLWSAALLSILFATLTAFMTDHYLISLAWLCLTPFFTILMRYSLFPSAAQTARPTYWPMLSKSYWRFLLLSIIMLFLLLLLILLYAVLLQWLLQQLLGSMLPLGRDWLTATSLSLRLLVPDLLVTFVFSWLLTAQMIFTFSMEQLRYGLDLQKKMDELFDPLKEAERVQLLSNRKLRNP